MARYSFGQVEAWAPTMPNDELYLRRARDGRVFLVAVDDDERPVAYGDLEPDGHINHLYCAPEATRTGLMITLYEQLERAAVEQGLSRPYTEASELARSFFHKRGFAVVERCDFVIRGIPIHSYRMDKRLGL